MVRSAERLFVKGWSVAFSSALSHSNLSPIPLTGFFFNYYYFFSESERFARSEVKSEWSPEQLGTEWSGALSEGAGMDSSEN